MAVKLCISYALKVAVGEGWNGQEYQWKQIDSTMDYGSASYV
jgi:hypothetical protein